MSANSTVSINNSSPHTKEPFSEYQKTGSRDIRDMLAEKYNYIPEAVARRYLNKGIDYDDIYQCGCIGLLNAIENFDPERGIKFPTYAIPCVLGEIKHFFREKGNCIKIPRRVYDIFYRAKKLSDSLYFNTGTEPTSSQIAQEMSISVDELECALSWGNNRIMKSIEDFIKEGESMTFSDLLGIEDNSLLLIEDKEFIKECLKSLTPDEKLFLKYRYYDEMTQTAIAKLMSVSQMRISRMEKNVLSALKKMYFEA